MNLSEAELAALEALEPEIGKLLFLLPRLLAGYRKLVEQVEYLSQFAHCSKDAHDDITHGGAAVCQACYNAAEARAEAVVVRPAFSSKHGKCLECNRPYTYHIERWGNGWEAASMPLEWHPFVEAALTERA